MSELTDPYRPEELLGCSFSCQCGKLHAVPTERFVYRAGALEELVPMLRKDYPGERVMVVADVRTRDAAGERVVQLLGRQGVDVVAMIVPDRHGEPPHADDITKDSLLGETATAGVLIAVGSGVINDLVKWVAYLHGKPYFTVPTAASMNGYASANVAATIDGLKVLFHAAPCRAVFAEPQVLADAPHELTTSGLGDVLAKSVSSADWRLNNYLFGDYYCQFAVDLLRDLEPVYLNNPQGIFDCRQDAVKALFEALFYSSLAMTITGTSSPASGGEHLISHTLDMIADRDGLRHDLHGRQVGVASILMAALYEKVMAIETPVIHSFPTEIDREFWGRLSPLVEKEYKQKLPRVAMAERAFVDKTMWQELRNKIGPDLVSAGRLKNCLKMAGGAHQVAHIRQNGKPLTLKQFLQVVLAANQMRQRFTILDVAIMLGVLPGDLENLVSEWLMA